MRKYKLVYKKGYINWFWYAYRIYFGWLVSPFKTDFYETKEESIENLKNIECSEIIEIE